MPLDRTELVLTGGLGNQLFQLAAAIATVSDQPIYCDWELGKPRLNKMGLPEISSFVLPIQVTISQKRQFSTLASKAIGFQLRKGISPRSIEHIPGFDQVVKVLSAITTFAYFKGFRWPSICQGVGYSEARVSKKYGLLIGYFQSYKWVSKPRVLDIMRSLKLANPPEEIDFYCKLASIENPLIVHIRLGDYIGHDVFGIPSPKYFVTAIGEIMSMGKVNKVWLFSDEPKKAIDFLSGIDPSMIRVIPEIDASASATLEVMRLGTAYVTSNSTFSWWAAYLSHTDTPYIICPTPWFRSQDEPLSFIPSEWHRRNAYFD